MQKLILTHCLFLLLLGDISAQITTAVHRAKFGVDAELNTMTQGTSPRFARDAHDWFTKDGLPDRWGDMPRFVIDTTGAAFIRAMYAIDPEFRKLPFFRTMFYQPFSIVDDKRLIDAVYIRDYHGVDSTTFVAGSNKNGDSPADWRGDAKNVLQKNDILDMYVHVRRDGPQGDEQLNGGPITDSLWFFGGLAIDGTNGSHYFDFEMYQTDIFFTRGLPGTFSGYGPDAGHTSWKFDPITGAVTTPGDVIFTAEYGGSGLQNLEARIWVSQSALSINSPNFNWGGQFDGVGAGAAFGYANVLPKLSGPFYTGLQNNGVSVNPPTWAGPFQLVRGDNSVQNDFDATQFLEFSVNMTKLGLDPISLLGGSACEMPFRRILVKTRSSTSFTAELKDFVGPFDFFNFKAVDLLTDAPILCGEMTSVISIINPLPTSTYTWETPDGNIVGSTSGAQIAVDAPGTYIVKQRLLDGCGEYATDQMVIALDSDCGVLPANNMTLTGQLHQDIAELQLKLSTNENVSGLELERSMDGVTYSKVKYLAAQNENGTVTYLMEDPLGKIVGTRVYYRVRIIRNDGTIRYSSSIRLNMAALGTGIRIIPNPVSDHMDLIIPSAKNQDAVVKIYNAAGLLMANRKLTLRPGNNQQSFVGMESWAPGLYPVTVITSDQSSTIKMIKHKNRN